MSKRAIGDHRLTERQEQVITGIEKGMTYQQVADQLGISVSAVDRHLHQARKHLRNQRYADIYAEVNGRYVREVCG